MASGFTGFFGATLTDMNNNTTDQPRINYTAENNNNTANESLTYQIIKPNKSFNLTCKQISTEVTQDSEIRWKGHVIASVSTIAQVLEVLKDSPKLVIAVISDGTSPLIIQHFVNETEGSNLKINKSWVNISGKVGVITQGEQRIFGITSWGTNGVRKIDNLMEISIYRLLAINNYFDYTRGYLETDDLDIIRGGSTGMMTSNNTRDKTMTFTNVNNIQTNNYSNNNIQSNTAPANIQQGNRTLEDTIKEILSSRQDGITKREILNLCMTVHKNSTNPGIITKMLDDLDERGEV